MLFFLYVLGSQSTDIDYPIQVDLAERLKPSISRSEVKFTWLLRENIIGVYYLLVATYIYAVRVSPPFKKIIRVKAKRIGHSSTKTTSTEARSASIIQSSDFKAEKLFVNLLRIRLQQIFHGIKKFVTDFLCQKDIAKLDKHFCNLLSYWICLTWTSLKTVRNWSL